MEALVLQRVIDLKGTAYGQAYTRMIRGLCSKEELEALYKLEGMGMVTGTHQNGYRPNLSVEMAILARSYNVEFNKGKK